MTRSYYIAPWVPNGAGDLEPSGARGTWQALEFGPMAVFRAEDPPGPGATEIGEDLDGVISRRVANLIHTQLGHPVPRTRLRLALGELAVTPGRGWATLRAARSGLKRLMAGGELIWSNVAGGATVQESWGVPDSTTDISGIYPWTQVQFAPPAQVGDLDVIGGALTQINCCVGLNARCDVPLRTDAQEVTATIEWLDVSGRGGPLTRFANDGSVTYYRGQVENSQLQSARIFRLVNGAGIILANLNYASMPTGTGVQFDVTLKSTEDDLHSLRFDDTELIAPTSNSVITGNLYAGAYLTADNPGVTAIHLLDWAARDIKAHGTSILQVLGAI